nr:hypothetical protein [uncultured Psychroserpens sp.]
MDKDFFKRVLKFAIALLVIIFLNSNYAKALLFNYDDIKEFDLNLKQLVYVFIVTTLIASIIIYRISSEKDNLIRVLKSFSYSVFVAMALTVLTDILDNSFVFHVNRMYTKKTEVKAYRVTYINDIDDLQTVTLKLNDNKNGFTVFNKFITEDAMKLSERNVVFLETGIGLFDRPFLFSGKLKPRKIY